MTDSLHPRNDRIENRLEELGIKVFMDLLDNNQPHVVDAGIDWCHGFLNTPTLHLRVAADTYRENLSFGKRIWHQQADGVCYAEYIGLIHYIYAKHGIVEKRAFMGFGGAVFEIHLANGEVIKTNNAWSSRAEAITSLNEPCKEVIIHEHSLDALGYGGYAVRLSSYAKFAEALGHHVADGIISCHPDYVMKPSHMKDGRDVNEGYNQEAVKRAEADSDNQPPPVVTSDHSG